MFTRHSVPLPAVRQIILIMFLPILVGRMPYLVEKLHLLIPVRPSPPLFLVLCWKSKDVAYEDCGLGADQLQREKTPLEFNHINACLLGEGFLLLGWVFFYLTTEEDICSWSFREPRF